MNETTKNEMQRRLMLAYVALEKVDNITDPVGSEVSDAFFPDTPAYEVIEDMLKYVLNQVGEDSSVELAQKARRLVRPTEN